MEAGKTTQGTGNGKGEKGRNEERKKWKEGGRKEHWMEGKEQWEELEEKGTGCGMRWKWWIVMVWVSGKEKNQGVQFCCKIMERNLTLQEKSSSSCLLLLSLISVLI